MFCWKKQVKNLRHIFQLFCMFRNLYSNLEWLQLSDFSLSPQSSVYMKIFVDMIIYFELNITGCCYDFCTSWKICIGLKIYHFLHKEACWWERLTVLLEETVSLALLKIRRKKNLVSQIQEQYIIYRTL